MSYLRKTAKFFQLLREGIPQQYYFKPDKSISPKLKDHEAGIIRMRVTLGNSVSFENNMLNIGGWDKPIIHPQTCPGILFANVYHVKINF